MRISKSRLTSYITCPEKYYFSYELRIRPVRISSDFLIGLSTHHLIATHFKQMKQGETCDLKEVLEDYWSPYNLENADFTSMEELEAARLESLSYAELFFEETTLEPVEVEYEFVLPLINIVTGETIPDLELIGFIDIIDRIDGMNRAIEIKTKARKADDFQAQVSLEITCYAYWLMFLSEQEVIPVAYANIIKNKKPYIQWQDQERSAIDFVELFNTAKTVAENITDKRFYKNSGVHCNWCDYKPVCAKDPNTVKDRFGEEALELLRERGLLPT